jgi:hypothetical protein
MFLEFHLVFYIIFPDFYFLKFPNFNSKNRRFLKSDPTDPAKFLLFSEKISRFFKPWWGGYGRAQSGPIFTFLIQFKFYPTKRSIFEKKISTNVFRILSSFFT